MKSIRENRKEILGFDDMHLLLTGIPIVALMIDLLFFGHLLEEQSFSQFGLCFVIAIMYTTIYWLGFREVYYFFVKKYRDIEENKKRILFTILGSLFCFVILFNFTHAIQKFIFDKFAPIKTVHILVEIIGSGTMIALVISIYEAIYSQTLLKKTLLEKVSLNKVKVEAELMGLRAHVNPHFLFNSLNTLTSLIHIDQDRAENFLTKLSKVYRYVLENKDKNIVTLSEEVEWATSYVHLLKDRFGDNIEVVIDIEAEFMDRQVLPLCLQILFENAIKHNIITSQNPLKIKVNAIENCLCVSNNLQTKNIIEDSTKFGLENIRKRYSYFTDELIFVSDKNGMFKVCLPYIST